MGTSALRPRALQASAAPQLLQPRLVTQTKHLRRLQGLEGAQQVGAEGPRIHQSLPPLDVLCTGRRAAGQLALRFEEHPEAARRGAGDPCSADVAEFGRQGCRRRRLVPPEGSCRHRPLQQLCCTHRLLHTQPPVGSRPTTFTILPSGPFTTPKHAAHIKRCPRLSTRTCGQPADLVQLDRARAVHYSQTCCAHARLNTRTCGQQADLVQLDRAGAVKQHQQARIGVCGSSWAGREGVLRALWQPSAGLLMGTIAAGHRASTPAAAGASKPCLKQGPPVPGKGTGSDRTHKGNHLWRRRPARR